MNYVDDIATRGANMAYIRSSMNEPLLDKEKEQELARKWKNENDEKALHELIRSYTRLVVAMASKFRNYGLPIGDLIQEGNVGLMLAASRFEPDRDVRFSTYASWWIRSSMQDYVLRNWSIVRTGTTAAQKSLFFNMKRIKAQISKAEGEVESVSMSSETLQEVADELGVNVRDVKDMERRMAVNDQSLNATIADESEEELQNFIADDRPNPEDVVVALKDSQTRSEWLNKALGELNQRERKIISDRHLSYETVTLEDLGKELGISKERVRQLESRAMSKLKTSISEQIGNDRESLFIY